MFVPCKTGRIIHLESVVVELNILNSKTNGLKENPLSFIFVITDVTRHLLPWPNLICKLALTVPVVTTASNGKQNKNNKKSLKRPNAADERLNCFNAP